MERAGRHRLKFRLDNTSPNSTFGPGPGDLPAADPKSDTSSTVIIGQSSDPLPLEEPLEPARHLQEAAQQDSVPDSEGFEGRDSLSVSPTAGPSRIDDGNSRIVIVTRSGRASRRRADSPDGMDLLNNSKSPSKSGPTKIRSPRARKAGASKRNAKAPDDAMAVEPDQQPGVEWQRPEHPVPMVSYDVDAALPDIDGGEQAARKAVDASKQIVNGPARGKKSKKRKGKARETATRSPLDGVREAGHDLPEPIPSGATTIKLSSSTGSEDVPEAVPALPLTYREKTQAVLEDGKGEVEEGQTTDHSKFERAVRQAILTGPDVVPDPSIGWTGAAEVNHDRHRDDVHQQIAPPTVKSTTSRKKAGRNSKAKVIHSTAMPQAPAAPLEKSTANGDVVSDDGKVLPSLLVVTPDGDPTEASEAEEAVSDAPRRQPKESLDAVKLMAPLVATPHVGNEAVQVPRHALPRAKVAEPIAKKVSAYSVTALCQKHTNGYRPMGLSRRQAVPSLLAFQREVQAKPPIPQSKKKRRDSDDDGSDLETEEQRRKRKRREEGWSDEEHVDEEMMQSDVSDGEE